MPSPFKPGRLTIVGVRANDVPTSVHFYRDVLGLHLMPHHSHRPAFDLGDDSYLVIVQGQPAPDQDVEPSRFPLITFAVEDLDRAIEHLRIHDVELPWGIGRGKDTRWIMFCDPAGNLVEFVQSDGPLHS